MKKIFFIIIMAGGTCLSSGAQTVHKDTTDTGLKESVNWLYGKVLDGISNIQVKGNHLATAEVREKLDKVIDRLLSQKGSMAEEVKKLLITPSGKDIDLELLKEIINIVEKDSVRKVEFNLDFFMNEIKAATNNVKNAAKKVAESK